ncbi:uncharacterized protein BYT42DRAFT_364731 [Radiomyces spectabilis]|uniref:uncharacterized protein n=1 Tax=Radiomyces spectabilis TaxID=64574 RepID=UPI00221F8E03|nr:uncharacterized protein BYT42DRAFT_364731 [Radiomyces spectabilis]KAI8378011.1 hypothetical protein BYT42DRAFT_364731 [Radiomyces spectabilis]
MYHQLYSYGPPTQPPQAQTQTQSQHHQDKPFHASHTQYTQHPYHSAMDHANPLSSLNFMSQQNNLHLSVKPEHPASFHPYNLEDYQSTLHYNLPIRQCHQPQEQATQPHQQHQQQATQPTQQQEHHQPPPHQPQHHTFTQIQTQRQPQDQKEHQHHQHQEQETSLPQLQQQQQHHGLSHRSEQQSLSDHFTNFHSDIVASFNHPSHTVYNPVDISSIVHSPVVSLPDLPATLPPINSTIFNGPSSVGVPLPTQPPSSSSNKRWKLPSRSRERAPWTPEEDNLLRLAVQLYGDKTEKWAKIAACVPGRTNKNCRKRWFHSLDPSLKKGAWTDEEDQLLREGVVKYPNQWSKIADMLEGRTDDQCAKRWRESLDPSIDRSDWTPEDDKRLMEKYEEFGSQWQKIAQFFDGRPGLHCRNRWRKLQRMIQLKRDKENAAVAAAVSFVHALAEDSVNRFQLTSHPASGVSSSPAISQQHQEHPPQQPSSTVSSTPPQIADASPLSSTSSSSSPHNAQLSSLLTQSDPSVLAQFRNSGTPPSLKRSSTDLANEPHQDLMPYGCDVPGCGANFPTSSGLFYHMKSDHPNLSGVEKPYRCGMPNCAKRYKNINGLQYHLRDAKGTSGHAVGSGDDALLGSDSLLNNDRRYRCEIPGCRKAYRTMNGLRYHQSHGHNMTMPLEEIPQFPLRREKWMLEEIKSEF